LNCGRDFWDYLQITVGILTLGVLVYYTFRTAGLHKEARKQNDNNICPFLSGIFINQVFYVKNMGRGPAINIYFKATWADGTEEISTHNVLSPDNFLFIQGPGGALIEAKYSNMFGKRYESKIKIDEEVFGKCILLEFHEASKKDQKNIVY
jgi:hypothetical protein